MNEKIKNNPTAIIIGGVVVIVLVSFSLMLGGGMMSGQGGGMMNGFGYNGWSWWTMLLGSLGMVAFWIALVWFVVLLSRRNSDPAGSDSGNGSKVDSRTNLELLQRRFAAGEITQDQYDSARHSLGL
jgi:uncharacterized membrane protein